MRTNIAATLSATKVMETGSVKLGTHNLFTAFTSCKIANSHLIKTSLAISTVLHLIASDTSEHYAHVTLESIGIDKIPIDTCLANSLIGT